MPSDPFSSSLRSSIAALGHSSPLIWVGDRLTNLGSAFQRHFSDTQKSITEYLKLPPKPPEPPKGASKGPRTSSKGSKVAPKPTREDSLDLPDVSHGPLAAHLTSMMLDPDFRNASKHLGRVSDVLSSGLSDRLAALRAFRHRLR